MRRTGHGGRGTARLASTRLSTLFCMKTWTHCVARVGNERRRCTAARSSSVGTSKRIAAVAMSGRVGESFDAIVTGVTPHGTFVRVVQPHVEGLLARGQLGADVGDKLRVTLVRTDIEHGFIDFARA